MKIWYFLNWDFGWMIWMAQIIIHQQLYEWKGFYYIDYIKKNDIGCHNIGPYTDRIIIDKLQ